MNELINVYFFIIIHYYYFHIYLNHSNIILLIENYPSHIQITTLTTSMIEEIITQIPSILIPHLSLIHYPITYLYYKRIHMQATLAALLPYSAIIIYIVPYLASPHLSDLLSSTYFHSFSFSSYYSIHYGNLSLQMILFSIVYLHLILSILHPMNAIIHFHHADSGVGLFSLIISC